MLWNEQIHGIYFVQDWQWNWVGLIPDTYPSVLSLHQGGS